LEKYTVVIKVIASVAANVLWIERRNAELFDWRVLDIGGLKGL
jgi:hypothetical protein